MSWSTDARSGPHRDLKVWRLGMQFAAAAYELTAGFPDDEKYGLTAQLRRSSVSVPSNIAEGSARRTTADFLRFLYNARGSLVEVDTQLELAEHLDYLDDELATNTRETFDDLSRGLQGLIDKLEDKR